MNPFDYVNDINFQKKDIIRNSENPELAEKSYKPFTINKSMSYFADTIMHANEVNRMHYIDKKLQNDYYLNTIRSGKRFSKWHKKQPVESIEIVQEYYNVSYAKAEEICRVLTAEQIDLIKIKIIKGGNNELRSKSASGSQTQKL